jgi:hypothetical protein
VEPAKAASWYAGLGIASWLFLELVYRRKGRPYWTGYGNPNQATFLGNTDTAIQQIAFWPIAIAKTVKAQIKV